MMNMILVNQLTRESSKLIYELRITNFKFSDRSVGNGYQWAVSGRKGCEPPPVNLSTQFQTKGYWDVFWSLFKA